MSLGLIIFLVANIISNSGVVWGAAITEGEERGFFTAKDWGYLILLYVLLHVIRAVLFLGAFPLTSRIGLKTNLNETFFQIFGGLHGAVGIALAIFLDNEISHHITSTSSAATDGQHDIKAIEEQDNKVFAMVGGIAFLTLVINATTAGPLLRKLGLADSTVTRDKMISTYKIRFREKTIANFVELLTQRRFRHVDFSLVKRHVHCIADLTRPELCAAVERYHDTAPSEGYTPPRIHNILPFLPDDEPTLKVTDTDNDNDDDELGEAEAPELPGRKVSFVTPPERRNRSSDVSVDVTHLDRKESYEYSVEFASKKPTRFSHMLVRAKSSRMQVYESLELSLQEFRLVFISMLRAGYEQQICKGELDDQQFLTIILQQSLEYAGGLVADGNPLKDWEYISLVSPKASRFQQFVNSAGWCLRNKHHHAKKNGHILHIEACLAFMSAHRWAQKLFHEEFQTDDKQLSRSAKIVLEESREQYAEANKYMDTFDKKQVQMVVSHKFCTILLTNNVHNIEELVRIGLLKDDEAEHLIEEIEEGLQAISDSADQDDLNHHHHDNEKSSDSDSDSDSNFDEEAGLATISDASDQSSE